MWTLEDIESAKEIARGQSPTLPPGKTVRHVEECVRYVHEIAEIGFVAFGSRKESGELTV